MKKIAILSFSILFFCQIVLSQNAKLDFGLHANLNVNTQRGNTFTSSDKLFGVGGAFDLRYHTSKNFFISVSPGFDQNGWALRSQMLESNPPGNGPWETDILSRLLYINVPVMANYHVGNTMKFHVGAGAFAGFLLESLIVEKPSEKNANFGTRSYEAGDYNSLNYGLALKVGADFPLSKNISLSFGIQDNLGLADINPANAHMRLNTASGQIGIIYKCSK